MESRGEFPGSIPEEEQERVVLVPEALSESVSESKEKGSSNKEPWEMSFEEFAEEYRSVMEAVALKEKKGGLDPEFTLNYRPVTSEEQKVLEHDWKEFSRQRGFSEEDIREYERWLVLSGQRDNLPGTVNDPWRRSRSNWEETLYKLHVQHARERGHQLSPEIIDNLS